MVPTKQLSKPDMSVTRCAVHRSTLTASRWSNIPPPTLCTLVLSLLPGQATCGVACGCNQHAAPDPTSLTAAHAAADLLYVQQCLTTASVCCWVWLLHGACWVDPLSVSAHAWALSWQQSASHQRATAACAAVCWRSPDTPCMSAVLVFAIRPQIGWWAQVQCRIHQTAQGC